MTRPTLVNTKALEEFLQRHRHYQHLYHCYYEEEGWSDDYRIDVFRLLWLDCCPHSAAVWKALYLFRLNEQPDHDDQDTEQ